jgi:hypothetical protein
LVRPEPNLKLADAQPLSFTNRNPNLDKRDTSYRIVDLPKNSTGAATYPPATVFISPNGPFFQKSTTVSIPSDNPQLSSKQAVKFATLADLGAFILLHELGHEVGVFPPDLFGFINGRHSLRVLDACFNKDAKVGN